MPSQSDFLDDSCSRDFATDFADPLPPIPMVSKGGSTCADGSPDSASRANTHVQRKTNPTDPYKMTKIEEMKSKYDSAMDELTQNKINAEREKALKDQRLTF